MKATDLHKLWASPDNTRLTPKQQSFRLPVHVAAKLDALCDLFPTKSRTQIVGDLLSAAIEDVVRSLPAVAGEAVGPGPDGEMHYAESGPIATFRRLANKYHRELERELGNKEVADLYPGSYVVPESDLKDS